MLDRLTGEYIGPRGPSNAAEWKTYRASAKKHHEEYWGSISDDQKKVMKFLHRHCHAASRMQYMQQFLITVGYEQTPKSEIQYKVTAERLDEFRQWLIDNGHEKEIAE